jgi:hypothetical protein
LVNRQAKTGLVVSRVKDYLVRCSAMHLPLGPAHAGPAQILLRRFGLYDLFGSHRRCNYGEMHPMHHFRARVQDSIEDTALDFVENEVGRHNWKENWQKWKAKPDLRATVQAWLHRYEIDHDPQGLIEYIDRLSATRHGKWSA